MPIRFCLAAAIQSRRVCTNTIEERRASVLRGRVLRQDGTELWVSMSRFNHPEFGQTPSRADGMFDLVVNGGGWLTVNYTKTGYLLLNAR